MSILGHRDYLVLDTVHGADVLADRLGRLGCNSEAINPYRGEKRDVTSYDALISPVHMYPSCSMLVDAIENDIPVYSHHAATRDIITELGYLGDVGRCVEVTGTVGKTSCSLLLLKMLNKEGIETVVHSSNGLYHNQLDNRVAQYSVAPYGTILALEKAIELDLTPDTWISEFSIGFTGIGDIATLTSQDQDYLIANKTKKASDTKIESIKNLQPTTLLNTPNLDESDNKATDLEVEYKNNNNLKINYEVNKLTGETNKGTVDCELQLYPYFKDSVRMAIITAASLNCSPQTINQILNRFKGVPGRMKKKKVQGRKFIDNSCAGTRVSSLNQYLQELQNQMNDLMDVVVLVGEDEQNICEEMDLEEVQKTVKKHRFKELITVGQKYSELGHNVNDVEEAIELAIQLSKPGDKILNFVKTWR
ncbi:hypothetical protein [Methanonatronarchaeum sp. AMET-Sl]|uniref:hypothetical protein n=1 Tax=Methanonatronarchaeum sp. AMET-Sl TaxID=3037654 RepID=UPI00244E4265|nr:hypothetical protein [Methanonatronarchaeum sp. AMET-Sl]WGI16870.1 hypothetical protein QEN48_05070 [Methanonatronarchaeum sp. AMET-Sl]